MKKAYFAGGCFWCVTPIYKMYGVEKVVCGYSGGDEINPTYEDVKSQKTGHRETIMLEYAPENVSYARLLDIFFANVDPFDSDKGHSYTLAIYYTSDEEKMMAENRIKKLRIDSNKDVFVSIEPFKSFYEAEEYHQDYYLKHPKEFEQELIESGRKKK